MKLELIIAFLLVGLLILLYKQQKKHWQLRRWQKALNLPVHQQHFQKIYRTIDGFTLSRQARMHYDILDYIYGEINFPSFIALLSLTKPNAHTVFYDLGSGIGKAVIAAAMVFPLRKSIGIEILPELHQASCEALKHLAQFEQYKKATTNCHFILADFLNASLDEANLIFINASTLFGTTWEKLCQRLHNLPQIETIITTSKPLSSTVFLPNRCTTVQMSWGLVPAYIHTRKTISLQSDENIE